MGIKCPGVLRCLTREPSKNLIQGHGYTFRMCVNVYIATYAMSNQLKKMGQRSMKYLIQSSLNIFIQKLQDGNGCHNLVI